MGAVFSVHHRTRPDLKAPLKFRESLSPVSAETSWKLCGMITFQRTIVLQQVKSVYTEGCGPETSGQQLFLSTREKAGFF